MKRSMYALLVIALLSLSAMAQAQTVPNMPDFSAYMAAPPASTPPATTTPEPPDMPDYLPDIQMGMTPATSGTPDVPPTTGSADINPDSSSNLVNQGDPGDTEVSPETNIPETDQIPATEGMAANTTPSTTFTMPVIPGAANWMTALP